MAKLKYGKADSIEHKVVEGVWKCRVILQGKTYVFVRTNGKLECVAEPSIAPGVYRNNLKHDAFVIAGAEYNKYSASLKLKSIPPSPQAVLFK